MKSSKLFNVKNIEVLERKERRIWQNPEAILGRMKINPEDVAADLGCGSGFFTIPLSSKVQKVYGIDVQQEMLEALKQKIQCLEIENIEPLLLKGPLIPLEKESVDLIVSVNSLHEFDDKDSMIEEMKRILKAGGIVLIVDFKKETTEFGPPITIRVSKIQATKLFKQHGFILKKSEYLSYHYLLVFEREKSGKSELVRNAN